MEDILPKERTAWLSEALALPDGLPQTVRPTLLANLLLHTEETSLGAWSARIRQAVEDYCARGCELVVLRLARDFSFRTPVPYHVELALRERGRGEETERLLTAQLMRELCTLCRERKLRLLLETDCDGAACELLDYACKSVGLPQLFVTASNAATRDQLIERMADASYTSVRLAVRLSDLPTRSERAAAWESIAARYPLGRLCVLCAADLRMLEGVREELAGELSRLN